MLTATASRLAPPPESASSTDAVEFGLSWTGATDRLLGSGIISPGRFHEVVTEFDLRPNDVPDDLRRRLFVMLIEAAYVGIRDLQVIIDGVLPWFAPSERDEVRRIAMSDGSGVNTATFAAWVQEHSRRAYFKRRVDEVVLTSAKPIHELARELLDEVTR